MIPISILYGMMIISFIAIIWSIYMFDRNQKVANYRMMLLHKINDRFNEDMVNCLEKKKDPATFRWKWRYNAYEKITYQEMFWQFWRPLNSFYKDLSFIK